MSAALCIMEQGGGQLPGHLSPPCEALTATLSGFTEHVRAKLKLPPSAPLKITVQTEGRRGARDLYTCFGRGVRTTLPHTVLAHSPRPSVLTDPTHPIFSGSDYAAIL